MGTESEHIKHALAEHDSKLPPPGQHELGDMIRRYITAEAEESKLETELRAVRARKSAIAREWVVRRGTTDAVIAKGESWSVQATRWGAFVFRRYELPRSRMVIALEEAAAAAPVEPERAPRKVPATTSQAPVPAPRKGARKAPVVLQKPKPAGRSRAR